MTIGDEIHDELARGIVEQIKRKCDKQKTELRDEIDMQERALKSYCNSAHAGEVDRNAREFYRRIHLAFSNIREALGMPEYQSKQ